MHNIQFATETNLILSNVDNDYVLFEISDELYALKLLNIKEIVSNRNIVEIEDLPDFIKGFANIRNVIFPIFDLKKNLALENIKKYGKYSVIIIFEDSSEKLALLADSVLDIYNIPEESFKPYTVCNDKYCNFIEYEVELNNQNVKIINAEKFIKLKYQM